jgi:hypothetical protein
MEREEDNKEEITWKEVTSEASLLHSRILMLNLFFELFFPSRHSLFVLAALFWKGEQGLLPAERSGLIFFRSTFHYA